MKEIVMNAFPMACPVLNLISYADDCWCINWRFCYII